MPSPSVTAQLDAALAGHFVPSPREVDDLLTSAYAARQALEREQQTLEAEIMRCAASAQDSGVAQELRYLSLRRKRIQSEVALLQRQTAAARNRFESLGTERGSTGTHASGE